MVRPGRQVSPIPQRRFPHRPSRKKTRTGSLPAATMGSVGLAIENNVVGGLYIGSRRHGPHPRRSMRFSEAKAGVYSLRCRLLPRPLLWCGTSSPRDADAMTRSPYIAQNDELLLLLPVSLPNMREATRSDGTREEMTLKMSRTGRQHRTLKAL